MYSKFVTLDLPKFWNPVEKTPLTLYHDTTGHQNSFFASQITPLLSTFGVLFLCEILLNVKFWALGCIFAELVTLQPLFQGETDGDQLFAIFDVLGSPNEEELKELAKRVPFDSKIFSEFKNIKGQNLKKKFSGVFENTTELFLDLLMKMLKFLPEKRITASKALTHPFFKDMNWF